MLFWVPAFICNTEYSNVVFACRYRFDTRSICEHSQVQEEGYCCHVSCPFGNLVLETLSISETMLIPLLDCSLRGDRPLGQQVPERESQAAGRGQRGDAAVAPTPATHAILAQLKAGETVCQAGERPKTL